MVVLLAFLWACGPRYVVTRTERAPFREAVEPGKPQVGGPAFDARTYGGSGGAVRVRGYYRRDGTYVRPHTRSRPR